MMLAPRAPHFLFMPMGGPSVLTPARPPVVLLFLVVILIAVLLGFLLKW